MNHGLPVLEAARGLDSWRRPEGSRPLGTRMFKVLKNPKVKADTENLTFIRRLCLTKVKSFTCWGRGGGEGGGGGRGSVNKA